MKQRESHIARAARGKEKRRKQRPEVAKEKGGNKNRMSRFSPKAGEPVSGEETNILISVKTHSGGQRERLAGKKEGQMGSTTGRKQ